jgi:hypothetical protein
MDQVITFLDDHAGSVTVLVTLAYVIITLALLLEARALRATGNVANLDVHPRPHGAIYVELVLENYGPAIAKSVRFRRWIEIEGVVVDGTDRTQAEPMFPVGRQRRFLETARQGQIDALQDLADRKAVLRAKWSWRDGRRWFGLWTTTHHGSVKYPAADLATGFYGGWALRERDTDVDADQMREEVKKTRAAVEDIAKTLSGPAMTLYIRQMLEDAKAQHSNDPGPADNA